MLSRSPDADWTIMNADFGKFISDKRDSTYITPMVRGFVENSVPWVFVTRVLCPIVIGADHWVLGVLYLNDFHMVVYDSFSGPVYKSRFASIMDSWKSTLPVIMKEIKERKLKTQARKFRFDYADNVPQQASSLGDCGVFVCKFLYQLINGDAITSEGNQVIAAKNWRAHMAETLYLYVDFPGKVD